MATPEIDPVMEAAGEFATTLGHTGLITWPQLQALEKLLDVHAHELAEKIRAKLPETVKERLGGGVWTITTIPTAKQAADLIDPEATP